MDCWFRTCQASTSACKDVVDSSTFYERPMYLPLKDQHLLTVSAPAMVELEIEATCCSQTETWLAYRQSEVDPGHPGHPGLDSIKLMHLIPAKLFFDYCMLKSVRNAECFRGMGNCTSLRRIPSATSV